MSEKKLYLIGHCEMEPRWKYEGIPMSPAVHRPDYHKIGIANNPGHRVSTMRSGTPHKLELITTLESDNAKVVEQRLHGLYRQSKQNGEWFKLTPNAVNSLKALDRIDAQDMTSLPRTQAQMLDTGLYVEIMNGREQ
jgi:hypothetical protein